MQQNLSCTGSSVPALGDRHLGKHTEQGRGERKEGREVSQIMALGIRDKASRLRRSKNRPTTEIAKLQTRLDCSLEKLGSASASTILLFSA